MEFFSLLLITTLMITVLTAFVWYQTKSVVFPLGVGLMYYWSLMGAWFIIYDQLGEDSGLQYSSIYEKLFPINLDIYYASTLVLYALFIVVVLLSLIIFTKNPRKITVLPKKKKVLNVSHLSILIVAALAGGASFLIFHDQIGKAINQGTSAYVVTRTEVNPLFTLAAILNRTALLPLSLGIAIFFSGPKARHIVGWNKIFLLRNITLAGYILELGGMYVYTLLLGNRNELVVSLLAGILFYLNNCPRPKIKTILVIATCAMTAISAIGVFRGLPITELSSALTFERLVGAFSVPFRSNEMFAAHFSLYGVLKFNVPLTYGSSLVSLVASIVPRIVWSNRPPDIYVYYAKMVNAVPGQGYTIHHATGWYLNFGILGIIVGAVSFGWIWATLYKRYLARKGQGIFLQIFTIIAPSVFTANIPAFIRAGPESYKSVIIILAIPTMVIALSSVHVRFVWKKSGVEKSLLDNQRTDSSRHITKSLFSK